MKKPIAITTGEPAGIGPDIALNVALSQPHIPMVLLGDRDLFAQRAKQLNLTIRLVDYAPNQILAVDSVAVKHIPLIKPCVAGKLNYDNVFYVLNMLDSAIDGCVSQQFSAVVTGPIHKAVMSQAGIFFSGHTEYFAKKMNVSRPVMLFVSDNLRMALATTHIPLKFVSESITTSLLEEVIEVLCEALISKFRLAKPHILVSALNPHAGEGGLLGSEEIDTIYPVILKFQNQGVHLEGPFPADTIYRHQKATQADAILMMYHDQGLSAFKGLSFGHSVNMTLGLAILRTSVDHGTALDLAGTGKAKSTSLLAALLLTNQLVNRYIT
jgi:4-hydroxythreonine-4-phosphate dehydrogenase